MPRPENKTVMTRREFIGRSVGVAAGVGLGLSLPAGPASAQAPGPKVVRRGGMVYRRLGRTELMVSEISVGGSPSPEPAVFSAALDRGVNYMDTSINYGNGNGERQVGQVVKGRRDKVIISTKIGSGRLKGNRTQELITAAEDAMERLQTDYIDIWCLHGVGSTQECLNDEILAGFERLKKDGKIRFAGVSSHADPVTVVPAIIQSGYYDVVLQPFNYFSASRVRQEDVKAGKVYENWVEESGIQGVLDLAKKHDVGLVAMKTMAGGDRQNLKTHQTGNTTLPQAKLKWVLGHDAIATALSEVLTFQILDENLAVVGQTLTVEEQAMLQEHLLARSQDVCRMCFRCAAACPASVPIPDVLRCITYHDEHGKRKLARRLYRDYAATTPLTACQHCHICAKTCPHQINIPAKLEYARSILA